MCSFHVSFVHEHVLCMYCIYVLSCHVWPELSPIKLSSVQFCSAYLLYFPKCNTPKVFNEINTLFLKMIRALNEDKHV